MFDSVPKLSDGLWFCFGPSLPSQPTQVCERTELFSYGIVFSFFRCRVFLAQNFSFFFRHGDSSTLDGQLDPSNVEVQYTNHTTGLSFCRECFIDPSVVIYYGMATAWCQQKNSKPAVSSPSNQHQVGGTRWGKTRDQ